MAGVDLMRHGRRGVLIDQRAWGEAGGRERDRGRMGFGVRDRVGGNGPDMTTKSKTGLIGSDTRACSGWLCNGSRPPAIAATTELCPAAQIATLSASIAPRLVSTPTTRPPAVRIAVTSQFSMMSTPC